MSWVLYSLAGCSAGAGLGVAVVYGWWWQGGALLAVSTLSFRWATVLEAGDEP